MNGEKRPVTVTVLAWIFIVVGVGGFVAHFKAFLAAPARDIWIEPTELLAAVCGTFLLRRQNWARWAAMGWIGLHVAVSLFHGGLELAVHCVLFGVFAWVLFRPAAGRYFARMGPARA